MSLVKVDIRGETAPVAHVILNRVAKLNALSAVFAAEIRDVALDLKTHTDLRAVVVESASDTAFIGGADVNELSHLKSPAEGEAFIRGLHEMIAAYRDLPVPVIAVVDGYCIGAGMEFVAACDIRIISSQAVFGMPETKLGIPSVIEAALLPRLLGWGRTSWLLLTGENIDAATAQAWGFSEFLVAPDALSSTVAKTTDALRHAAPKAVRDQKALMRRWETLSLEASIEAGVEAFAGAFATNEPAQYLAPILARMAKK
jgi:enoyl-CoA hydratase/carnithine racemase